VRIPFNTRLCRLLVPAVLISTAMAVAQGSPPPNIVFILADDLGYGDLGCYGQRRIHTPNIDRLASDGVRFTRAYAGSTVCAPSRCVLMTGLHTGHARVRGNGGATPLAQALRPEDVTVARVLKDSGYATALIGKWGLGDVGGKEVGLPTRQGFDRFFGYLNQTHAHNYYPTFLWRNEERFYLDNLVPNETAVGAGVATARLNYSPDLITEAALAFVRRAKDRPFFLYYSPTIPHANNEAGKQGMEVPDFGEYQALDWPDAQKAHAAMISRLDRDVERLLGLLQALSLEDNTLVIFSSDNGPHREGGNDPDFNDSNGPLRGIKRDLYEGGIRVPFIVRWPGAVPRGRVSERTVWFADFLPTAADVAGAKPPPQLDGISLNSVFRDPSRPLERPAPLYWEFFEGGFKQALLDGDWKLVNLGGRKPLELYNIANDVGESHNLAAAQPDVVRKLQDALGKSRTDTPDWPVKPVP